MPALAFYAMRLFTQYLTATPQNIGSGKTILSAPLYHVTKVIVQHRYNYDESGTIPLGWPLRWGC